MVKTLSRDVHRLRIHKRLRRRLQGTPERPRLAVFRSLKHIYAQVIDDRAGRTLVSSSSDEKLGALKAGGNVPAASEVGRILGERAQAKGIQRVVFDRGGYRYHGRVKALAEAARKAGLEF